MKAKSSIQLVQHLCNRISERENAGNILSKTKHRTTSQDKPSEGAKSRTERAPLGPPDETQAAQLNLNFR